MDDTDLDTIVGTDIFGDEDETVGTSDCSKRVEALEKKIDGLEAKNKDPCEGKTDADLDKCREKYPLPKSNEAEETVEETKSKDSPEKPPETAEEKPAENVESEVKPEDETPLVDKKAELVPWSEIKGEVVVSEKGVTIREKSDKYPNPEDQYPSPTGSSDSKLIIGDSKRKMFYDSIGSLDLDSSVLSEGELSVDAVIAKELVQTYEEDGKELKVLKPAKELKNAVDALKIFPKPVTDEHPKEKVVTNIDEIKGKTKNPSFIDNTVPCVLVIKDKAVIDSVRKGIKTDVSIGFYSDLIVEPGEIEIDGTKHKYDARQENILIDHVAITKEGRCNKMMGCGIKLDSKDVPQKLQDEVFALNDTKRKLQEQLDSLVKEKKQEKIAELLELTQHYTEAEVDAMSLESINDKIEWIKSFKSKNAIGVGKLEKDDKSSLPEKIDEIFD